MAKKSKAPDPFDDLAAGIKADTGIEQEQEPAKEDELIKVVEQPAPQNRFGIVVEDLDVPAITGAKVDAPQPPVPDEQEPDLSHMSPSARERTLAEMALGRENLKKIKAGG